MRKVVGLLLRPQQQGVLRHRGQFCNFSEFFPSESMLMPGKFKDPVEQNTEIIPIDFYENKSEIFIDAKLPGVVIKTPLVYSYYAHYR